MVDIYFLGQACFRIKGKNTAVVVDPYDAEFIGLSPLKLEADIVCVTHAHKDHSAVELVKGASETRPSENDDSAGKPFVISGPGEYEIRGVNIVGVSSFHDDSEGSERGRNVIYQITIDGVNIVHLGDLGQKKLTQAQIEEINCDVLLLPVGGVYTIDGKEAVEIVSQLEPKVIIPMHYKLPNLKVELKNVSEFLAAVGKEKMEPLPKYSITEDRMPQETEVVVLEAINNK